MQMPSTHTSLLYHLVFATKNREPLIAAEWRTRWLAYLGGTIRRLDGAPQGVGGVADHVHRLIDLKPNQFLSDFRRELKQTSSPWVAETRGWPSFRWQEGYGAFTVSASARLDLQD